MRPLAIDLFCGLGGWTDGLLAEGYDVIGFDIERHEYGEHRYPAQLVVQDVLTLHGSQFRDATLIVASPPCQEYSYMAMPWSKGKVKAAAIRADKTGRALAELNKLFNACFRIQTEASVAAGRHIPLIVENVRGAQPWVGRARWNFGSFYLWGDVPALMPITLSRAASVVVKGRKSVGPSWDPTTQSGTHGMKRWTNLAEGFKSAGMNWSDQTKRWQDFTRISSAQSEARKGTGSGAEWFDQNLCAYSSRSMSRKAASAMIAKIPLVLSRHIAAVYYPLRTPPAVADDA